VQQEFMVPAGKAIRMQQMMVLENLVAVATFGRWIVA